jgi:hypothetical protein
MAKVLIRARAVGEVSASMHTGHVFVGLEMTEEQMFNALKQFLGKVTDATWTEWQDKINGEGAYGQGD